MSGVISFEYAAYFVSTEIFLDLLSLEWTEVQEMADGKFLM